MRGNTRARGLYFENTNDGIVVLAVEPGSAAEAAGLEYGDRILSMYAMPLTGALRDELMAALYGRCLVRVRNGRSGQIDQRWIEFGEPDPNKVKDSLSLSA